MTLDSVASPTLSEEFPLHNLTEEQSFALEECPPPLKPDSNTTLGYNIRSLHLGEPH